MFKYIKALEIKNFIVFNLAFANSTILSSFVFFFWVIYVDFLIPAVITEIFVVIAELAIPTEIPTKEAIAETEPHPVTV